MSGDWAVAAVAARDAITVARRQAAIAMARLAECCVRFAELRTAADQEVMAGLPARDHEAKPGEFVADEISLLLREQPYQVRCLIARSRRLTTGLPSVWHAFKAGDVDAEQVRVIDRIARRASEAHTLTVIGDKVVTATQSRSPKQLQAWLLRLLVRLVPAAF